MRIKNQILMSGIVFNCLFLFSFIAFTQSTTLNCKQVKTGTFYFYPAKSNEQYRIVRDSFLQKEINLMTKDTSFWKIHWQNDCTFSTKFIKMTQPLAESVDSFLNVHVTVIKILAVKKDYYIFKQGLDSLNNMPIIDTIWFQPRKQAVL